MVTAKLVVAADDKSLRTKELFPACARTDLHHIVIVNGPLIVSSSLRSLVSR